MHKLDFSLLRKRLASLIPGDTACHDNRPFEECSKDDEYPHLKGSESPFSGWNEALNLFDAPIARHRPDDDCHAEDEEDEGEWSTDSAATSTVDALSSCSESQSSEDDLMQYLSDDEEDADADDDDDFYQVECALSSRFTGCMAGMAAARMRGRRNSVSAEVLPSGVAHVDTPSGERIGDDLARVLAAHPLFGHLDADQFARVMDAMTPLRTIEDQVLVHMDQDADAFYIVQKGVYLLTQRDKTTICLTAGDCYGDVALMYPSTSDVAIQSLVGGMVWTIDRMTYRSIITAITMQKRQYLHAWLAQHPCFCSLLPEERDMVLDELVCVEFGSGETVLQRGHPSDYVYIVLQGTCNAIVQTNGTVHSTTLGENQYFSDDMYGLAASVVAMEKVRLIALSKHFILQFFGFSEPVDV